jgi:hypothetical protein
MTESISRVINDATNEELTCMLRNAQGVLLSHDFASLGTTIALQLRDRSNAKPEQKECATAFLKLQDMLTTWKR